MTEHAHHNIASAASPDDAAREAAPSDELSSSSAGQPSAPEARAKASRAQRFAAVAAALTLLFAAAVLATQAFNVELFDAHHPFSFGAPDIEVVETMLDASGNEVPALVDDRINPGSGAVSRIVRVQNLGTHPIFVRVMLSVEGVRPNGDALSLDHAVTYGFGDASAWQRGQEGRYYLAIALEPDQTTPVLIDSFEVEAGALAGIDQLKLVIKADGVQSEHNATSSLTAEGWPA